MTLPHEMDLKAVRIKNGIQQGLLHIYMLRRAAAHLAERLLDAGGPGSVRSAAGPVMQESLDAQGLGNAAGKGGGMAAGWLRAS